MSLLPIPDWIAATYAGAGAPTVRTVRRWIDAGLIHPRPEKHGRAYYLSADARYCPPGSRPPEETTTRLRLPPVPSRGRATA